MADVITRLKLESGEYDSKIKRAVTGLQQMESECRKVGGTLAVLEKDQLDYVKSLGQMQTVANNTRGKLNELTQAYTELSVQYKRLTDEEKKGDFGKALSSSLDQLKTRINDTKSQLKDIDKELVNTKQSEDGAKSGLESLTSALGINVKSLAGWGAALAAGKVALDVAKDAFFASEANVDEWGRTMDASKSLYEGFLTALNTGDISGYLSRIDDIVTAARTAYNELDRLGTLKTIQAPKFSAQQTENERIRSMIQTGRYIAPIDGRRNAVFNGREMKNGDKLTAGQIRYLEKQLQNGMQTVVKLVGNEVKQTGKAIDAVYKRQAKELGISLKEFRKGTSSMEEFEKRMAGYDKYQQWREQHTTIDQKSGRETVARGNPYAIYGKWGTFRVDGERYNQLVQLIQQRDQQAAQAYGMQSQAYRTMNRAEGFTVSKLMGNGGTGNKNKKEYDDLQKVQQEIAKLTKEAYTADESRVEEIKAEIAGLQEEEKRLTKIRDLVTGKNTTVEMVTGLSGFNEQTISAWTSMMKSEISKADLGSDLYNSLTQNLSDMSTLTTAVHDAMKLGLKIPQEDVQEMFEAIFDRGTLPDDLYAGMIQKFIDEFKERTGKDLQVGSDGSMSTGTDKGKDKDKGNDPLKEFKDKTGKLIGGLSDVSSGIKKLGIEIPEEIDELIGIIGSVMQIVQGVGTIISVFQTSAITANTIALGTLTAAVTANTVTNAIPFLAGGGIVPAFAQGGLIGRAASGMLVGNHMSGDNLRLPVNGGSGGFIGVNDGEVILNKAQQGNLASQLEGGGIGNLHLDTVISGEDIRVVLKNNGRRTGRGEYITSRNSRS